MFNYVNPYTNTLIHDLIFQDYNTWIHIFRAITSLSHTQTNKQLILCNCSKNYKEIPSFKYSTFAVMRNMQHILQEKTTYYFKKNLNFMFSYQISIDNNCIFWRLIQFPTFHLLIFKIYSIDSSFNTKDIQIYCKNTLNHPSKSIDCFSPCMHIH